MPARRLPAEGLRRAAAVEGRHAEDALQPCAAQAQTWRSRDEPLRQAARARSAQGKPLRVGLIGAGKFGAMYLAQVPRRRACTWSGIADLSPANARANLERVGWKPRALRRHVARRRARQGRDARRRRLAGAGRASARSTSSSNAPAIRSPRSSTPGGVPPRQARGHGHRRGRRVLRPAARAQGRGGGRGLQPRLRRPAGADLRSGGLGARRRVSAWSPRAAATSGCRTSRSRRPKRCGATTA